ncbi:gamma-glutamylcyclotransferase family protein [Thalassotalea sp. PLHSN55]|uniref:gamma-glutamylcyclotransferase family protein n=1 Tax=Thalassotalea sp. PLHSN55 TaxID=3435888 RepID=UPI003F825236
MKYFAYGSNMSTLRLQQRVPSAKKIGRYTLNKHQLRFHKASTDGSAKCDAYFTDNHTDQVIGALFEMDKSDKVFLDKAEGLGFGYDEKMVQVVNDDGEYVNALLYIATNINANLAPYSWYVNHVAIGAKETKLPTEQLNNILSTVSQEDKDLARDERERAIYLTKT